MLVGLEAFDATVKGWLKDVEKEAAEAAVGLAKLAFDNLLRNSPQYSGDFTSGWGIGYGNVVSNFKAGRWPEKAYKSIDPFGRGDVVAIEQAKADAKWGTLKLGTPIYISNDAHHDEAYAWKIENGQISFRTPNMGSDHLVERACAYVGKRYASIGKSQLEFLRSVGA